MHLKSTIPNYINPDAFASYPSLKLLSIDGHSVGVNPALLGAWQGLSEGPLPPWLYMLDNECSDDQSVIAWNIEKEAPIMRFFAHEHVVENIMLIEGENSQVLMGA